MDEYRKALAKLGHKPSKVDDAVANAAILSLVGAKFGPAVKAGLKAADLVEELVDVVVEQVARFNADKLPEAVTTDDVKHTVE